MNCHYCDRECAKGSNDYQYCRTCYVDYAGHKMTMWCLINHKLYSLQINYEHTQYPAQIVHEKEVLINFEKIPDINPLNIEEKIRLYLKFL